MPEAIPCSMRSLELGEPLLGTASRVRRWLMVEQPGRWGHDALVDSDLPREVGEHLASWGRRERVRVLLVKRRDRASSKRRCFVASTTQAARTVGSFEIDHPRELLATEAALESAEPRDEPLFLACTHGKHDQCCARLGPPIARALESGGHEVWEATHVGGDRFAGNLVAFPDGLYFGRVTVDSAPWVAAGYTAGRITLDHYRGRAGDAPAVQAAEVMLRRELGLDAIGAVSLTAPIPGVSRNLPRSTRDPAYETENSAEREGGVPGGMLERHRVGFALRGGARRIVTLDVTYGEPQQLTCKASHPHRPRHFTLVSITP